MVKLSEMKLSEIRKEITFIDPNGDKKVIKIYNPNSEDREKLTDIIKENTSEDGHLVLDGNKMLLDIFPILTDIEIDVDDIEAILDKPSRELVLVNSEINTIFNEISMDILIDQRHEYEKLLLLSEQMWGMNMVAYLREKMSKTAPLNDFDPLNSKAKEERNAKEIEELSESYMAMGQIYDKSIDESKKEVEVDG